MLLLQYLAAAARLQNCSSSSRGRRGRKERGRKGEERKKGRRKGRRKERKREKGGWENDETVREAAVREAIEEAGVRGDIMGFLGCYHFKSKSHQDEFSPEGLCKAAMFAMHVKEELNSWPEQSTRQRSWLTVPEAMEQCRHPWMRDALLKGFSRWHAGISIEGNENDLTNPTESTPTR
uniref:Nudix hydrolase domain-containing protein n=1 Tax=Ananas comosus var. bracteatus TaxID=296719 RepID=A0A6V7NFV1_ANACO|nr:unnamed protein product [Ananas comosus var. bracteatus]